MTELFLTGPDLAALAGICQERLKGQRRHNEKFNVTAPETIPDPEPPTMWRPSKLDRTENAMYRWFCTAIVDSYKADLQWMDENALGVTIDVNTGRDRLHRLEGYAQRLMYAGNERGREMYWNIGEVLSEQQGLHERGERFKEGLSERSFGWLVE